VDDSRKPTSGITGDNRHVPNQRDSSDLLIDCSSLPDFEQFVVAIKVRHGGKHVPQRTPGGSAKEGEAKDFAVLSFGRTGSVLVIHEDLFELVEVPFLANKNWDREHRNHLILR
jgi:hypothetical protein